MIVHSVPFVTHHWSFWCRNRSSDSVAKSRPRRQLPREDLQHASPGHAQQGYGFQCFLFRRDPLQHLLFPSERRLTDNQLKKEHKTKVRISKVILANKQFNGKARFMEKEHKLMAGTVSFTKVVYL